MATAQPATAGELEQYRRELTGYCYRMLGSGFEADDAVQETMLRAWRAAGGFEGRSSVRSWLYRIATNICLDMLRGRQRRALPILHGDQLVGKLDAIADRKASVLRVSAIHEDVRFSAAMAKAVRREIDDLARWLALETVG